MKTVIITSFNKTTLRLTTTKTCEGISIETCHRWIGRTGKDDMLMRWPARSLDLTLCDFVFWGFVKDTVFVPPLPTNLRDLRNRITAAVALVDRDMLTRVERDGLSHRCLPYYQMWTHWASVKCLKKTWRVSFSIGVRITMIRCVVHLLRIFKMFHGLMNNLVCVCVYIYIYIHTYIHTHTHIYMCVTWNRLEQANDGQSAYSVGKK